MNITPRFGFWINYQAPDKPVFTVVSYPKPGTLFITPSSSAPSTQKVVLAEDHLDLEQIEKTLQTSAQQTEPPSQETVAQWLEQGRLALIQALSVEDNKIPVAQRLSLLQDLLTTGLSAFCIKTGNGYQLCYGQGLEKNQLPQHEQNNIV